MGELIAEWRDARQQQLLIGELTAQWRDTGQSLLIGELIAQWRGLILLVVRPPGGNFACGEPP